MSQSHPHEDDSSPNIISAAVQDLRTPVGHSGFSPNLSCTELQDGASTESVAIIVKDTCYAREMTIEPEVSDHSFINRALLIFFICFTGRPTPRASSSPSP